jgi:hypothetical protein
MIILFFSLFWSEKKGKEKKKSESRFGRTQFLSADNESHR